MLLEKKKLKRRKNLDSLSFHYKNLIKIYTKKPKRKFLSFKENFSKTKNFSKNSNISKNSKRLKNFNFDIKHEMEKYNLNRNLKKLKKRPFSNFSKNFFYDPKKKKKKILKKKKKKKK